MKKSSCLFSLFTLLICSWTNICAPAWSAQKTAYLHLTQAHHVLGPMEILASEGISILKLKQMGCSVFMDARQKDPVITIVSRSRKNYFQTPLSKFDYSLVTTLDTISDIEWEPRFWKFFGKTTVCGFAANEYRYKGTTGVYDHAVMPYLPGKKGETSVNCQVICLQSPQVTNSFCQLLKKMEHVPVLNGIPLKMETIYTLGLPRNQLSTVKISIEKLDQLRLPDLTILAKATKSSEVFYGQTPGVYELLGK